MLPLFFCTCWRWFSESNERGWATRWLVITPWIVGLPHGRASSGKMTPSRSSFLEMVRATGLPTLPGVDELAAWGGRMAGHYRWLFFVQTFFHVHRSVSPTPLLGWSSVLPTCLAPSLVCAMCASYLGSRLLGSSSLPEFRFLTANCGDEW